MLSPNCKHRKLKIYRVLANCKRTHKLKTIFYRLLKDLVRTHEIKNRSMYKIHVIK